MLSPQPAAGDSHHRMKKVFPLQVPEKVAQRVVEAVKNDVRKYVKRERRKTLPEGFTQWNFNCKAGPVRETAPVRALDELSVAIDEVANAGGAEIYIEVLAEAGHRPPPLAAAPSASAALSEPLPPVA